MLMANHQLVTNIGLHDFTVLQDADVRSPRISHGESETIYVTSLANS